jgi:hypothetical protein
LSVRATVFVPVSRRRGTVAAGAPDEAWAAVAAVGVGGDYDDADVADGPRKLEGGVSCGFALCSILWDRSWCQTSFCRISVGGLRNFRLLRKSLIVPTTLVYVRTSVNRFAPAPPSGTTPRTTTYYSGLRPKQGYRSTGTKKNVCRMYRVRTSAHSRHGLLPPNTNHKQENHGRIKWILVLRYLIHFLAKSLI